MIKVVIADDEQHICRLIQALINWEGLGMELAGVAGNGIEALALLKREHPDILITDIRMPGCSGLELIEKAREVCKNLQIVVISGYANFEYAQSALRFGVRDYLLKPINKDELGDTMRKLKKKIEEEKSAQAQYENSRQSRQKDADKLRQLLVERLLDEQAPALDEQLLKEQYYFEVKPGYFLGFSLRVDAIREENSEEMMEVYTDKMNRIFESGLSRCCTAYSFYRHHFSIYGILNFTKDSLDEVKAVLRDCLNQMNAQKNLFGNVTFTLGVGSLETKPQLLALSLQNARHAVRERLLAGTGQVIEYEEKPPVLYEKKLLDRYSRELTHVLEVLSVDELKEANDRLYHSVMETKNLQGEELYDLVIEAGNMFMVKLNLQNKPEMLRQFTMQSDRCIHAAELFDNLLSFEEVLLRERIKDHEDDAARPVRMAKQYIQKHFAEPISQEKVSEMVGLSPAYFSVLFKKETQVGFARYLMNVRMDQAKLLLRETNLPVSEICKKVGYNDQKYFTQTFEKIAGVKPAVFRKLYG